MRTDEKDGLTEQTQVVHGVASHDLKIASSTVSTDAVTDPKMSTKANMQTWSFEQIPTEVKLRGGGCASSLLCDVPVEPDETAVNFAESDPVKQQLEQERDQEEQDNEIIQNNNSPLPSPVWTGWAELENDPEIFTILLQEWGVPNIQVNEILDMIDLTIANPTDTLGLIFLSRYVPPNEDNVQAPSPSKAKPSDTDEQSPASPPWFANQISKFSCGTVALMNILMNTSSDTDLSETLSSFKQSTGSLSSKDRGIAVDRNAQFRDIHNSFSTRLDRMIVDVMLKEDAQKYKQKLAAEARQAKLADKQAAGSLRGPKRKRGGTSFTKRRKRKTTADDEDESGFHFVAYISAHTSVWKLDGMLNHPRNLGCPDEKADLTWLNVAAADLLPQMEEALSSGQECSLMSVTKTRDSIAQSEEAKEVQRTERERKQEDWAPFIENMLRLHAEKGDLQELLGL